MTTDTSVIVSREFLYSLRSALSTAEVMACDMKADAGGDLDLDDLVQYSYENCDGLIKHFADLQRQIRLKLQPSE